MYSHTCVFSSLESFEEMEAGHFERWDGSFSERAVLLRGDDVMQSFTKRSRHDSELKIARACSSTAVMSNYAGE